MKTFDTVCAQGDIDIVKVESLPSDVTLKTFEGHTIVAHSETGHHHFFNKSAGVKYFESKDPNVAFLRLEEPALLEHARSFDTHESISVPAGTYKVIRQTEYTPEGLRQVQD